MTFTLLADMAAAADTHVQRLRSIQQQVCHRNIGSSVASGRCDVGDVDRDFMVDFRGVLLARPHISPLSPTHEDLATECPTPPPLPSVHAGAVSGIHCLE